MKIALYEDLPIQDQVKIEELISNQFPNATGNELEIKAKKYYEYTQNPK
jgi:hypothetical protein|tara:strand:+ start:7774 stop:7920 length:147 start_codon:yes stop_codon:yes gene_type:complete